MSLKIATKDERRMINGISMKEMRKRRRSFGRACLLHSDEADLLISNSMGCMKFGMKERASERRSMQLQSEMMATCENRSSLNTAEEIVCSTKLKRLQS